MSPKTSYRAGRFILAVCGICILAGVLVQTGCNYFDPNLKSLARDFPASSVPDRHGYIVFLRPIDDADFAAAFGRLKAYGVSELNLMGSSVSDTSAPLLARLPKLRVLHLQDTLLTPTGLAQLKALPRLKRIYVSAGRYDPAELPQLRAALPGVAVEESRLRAATRPATQSAASSAGPPG